MADRFSPWVSVTPIRKDNGAPGLRHDYGETYYAAFMIGPDGHNIEVVTKRAV